VKLSLALAASVLFVGALAKVAVKTAIASNDEQVLLQVDREAFGSGASSIKQNDYLLDPNFTWTDSSGKTRNKSEIVRGLRSGKGLPMEVGSASGGRTITISAIPELTNAKLGVIQANSGNMYVLRIWAKHSAGWQLLIYQAVSIGAHTSAEPGKGDCQNPCNTVPFKPRNEDEREVITAYQAVEQAVTAHNSAAWAAHIADEFFAVTSNSGNLYNLRIWVKRGADWQLLIYQDVSIGAPPTAEAGTGECENPCNTVPFQPQSEDEREVITAYQAVERAVTAHDSAAWAAHIADEFIAVTSNSDRPLDKGARMAGLDNQKVAGIAPFPLVSARMFEFGDAMVMISLQQPEHGLPLHVTRVWFKRNGTWLEAYSYQTTIQAASSSR